MVNHPGLATAWPKRVRIQSSRNPLGGYLRDRQDDLRDCRSELVRRAMHRLHVAPRDRYLARQELDVVPVGVLDVDTTRVSKAREDIDVFVREDRTHRCLVNAVEGERHVIDLSSSVDISRIFQEEAKLIGATFEKASNIHIELLVGWANRAWFEVLMGDHESEQVHVEVLRPFDVFHVDDKMIE